MTTKLSEQDRKDLLESYPNTNPANFEVEVEQTNKRARELALTTAKPTRTPKEAVKGQKPINETDWQKTVVALAHANGWKVAHFRGAWSKDGKRFVTPVAADGAGFPDLVLAKIRNGHQTVIFAELKSDKGKISPEQMAWIELLFAQVWRPSDYEKIVELLK